MDLRTARQRVLHALDVLHEGQGLDALRLQEAIDELILCHLREWKRMGCMDPSHISCERCSPCASGSSGEP